jgi:hypothetical protein
VNLISIILSLILNSLIFILSLILNSDITKYQYKIKLLLFNLIFAIFSSLQNILSPSGNIFSPILLLSADDSNPQNNSNAQNDSNPQNDSDPEDHDVMEVDDDDYNGPEQIMDDLDRVDKARVGDGEALDELKDQYPEFFEDEEVPDYEALDGLEEYLEDEFPHELEQSEREADELERLELEEKQREQWEREQQERWEWEHKERERLEKEQREREQGEKEARNNNWEDSSDPNYPSNNPRSLENDNNLSARLLILLGGIFEAISEILEKLF